MAPLPAPRDAVLSPRMQTWVEGYFKLALKMAWDFLRTLPPGSKDIQDLISVSTWALVDAGLRYPHYCEQNGYSLDNEDYFCIFLQRNIKGALYDFCRSEDFVTRQVRDLSRDIYKLASQGVSRKEICERLQISDKKFSMVTCAVAQRPWALNVYNEDGRDAESIVTSGHVESSVSESYLLDAFSGIVKSLPELKQAILALRYYSNKEFPQIALVLSIPASLVQKLHTETIIEIKERMEKVAGDAESTDIRMEWQGY